MPGANLELFAHRLRKSAMRPAFVQIDLWGHRP